MKLLLSFEFGLVKYLLLLCGVFVPAKALDIQIDSPLIIILLAVIGVIGAGILLLGICICVFVILVCRRRRQPANKAQLVTVRWREKDDVIEIVNESDQLVTEREEDLQSHGGEDKEDLSGGTQQQRDLCPTPVIVEVDESSDTHMEKPDEEANCTTEVLIQGESCQDSNVITTAPVTSTESKEASAQSTSGSKGAPDESPDLKDQPIDHKTDKTQTQMEPDSSARQIKNHEPTEGVTIKEEPDTLKDMATEPDTLKNTATEPDTLKDMATEPDTLKDKATEPDTLKNTATEPDTLKDIATEPDTLKDKATEPDTLKDKAIDERPDALKSTATEQDALIQKGMGTTDEAGADVARVGETEHSVLDSASSHQRVDAKALASNKQAESAPLSPTALTQEEELDKAFTEALQDLELFANTITL